MHMEFAKTEKFPKRLYSSRHILWREGGGRREDGAGKEEGGDRVWLSELPTFLG